MAPVKAVTEPSFTVNGFTGLFAEPKWTFNDGTANTGTGSITSSTLTMTSPTGGTPSDATSFSFNTNSLLASYPQLVDGMVSFRYSVTTADDFFGRDPFFYFVGTTFTQVTPNFTPGPGPISGTATFNLAQGQTFGFTLTNGGPDSTNARPAILSITNFGYTGGPVAIPGPLPVLAAAAALGWSGVLRQRIRKANQTSSIS